MTTTTDLIDPRTLAYLDTPALRRALGALLQAPLTLAPSEPEWLGPGVVVPAGDLRTLARVGLLTITTAPPFAAHLTDSGVVIARRVLAGTVATSSGDPA